MNRCPQRLKPQSIFTIYVRAEARTLQAEAPPLQHEAVLLDLRLYQTRCCSPLACHSLRNACMGSTEAARRAGTKVATNDASASNKATAPRVAASHARTPNNKLRINIDVPTEQTSPMIKPVTTSHPACSN